jgi:NAD(P)-dependent dehydrogenase (short-subunit alcohol dehydrogenase family)
MTSGTTAVPAQREPELAGQTVILIGGSSGIGFETARRARAEGAEVILTGRNPDRLEKAAAELGAQRTAAFDANDAAALARFFRDAPTPIDHVMVTAGGPRYGPLLEMDLADMREALTGHVVLGLEVARNAVGTMRPGGTLLLMGGTGGRSIRRGVGIAAGFVDTPLSAALLGDQLEARRDELRATLPIGRVVGPADVAALAVHIMVNTALTGATYDIDGRQQLVS